MSIMLLLINKNFIFTLINVIRYVFVYVPIEHSFKYIVFEILSGLRKRLICVINIDVAITTWVLLQVVLMIFLSKYVVI